MARTPQELQKHREFGCSVCVLAQILYVYGAVDRIDLADLERRLGFRDHEVLSRTDMYSFLLTRGFAICEFSTFRHEAFLRHGVAYLRNGVYGTDWDEQVHGAYFSSERISDMLYSSREFLNTLRKQPPNTYFHVQRNMQLGDALSALGKNCVVDMSVRDGDDSRRSTLLTPATNGLNIVGWLYEPKRIGTTVSHLHARRYWTRALPGEGAAVIWPR